MPALSTTTPIPPIKGLILADSGLGKTGSLASLAQAGFNLKLFDADANHGILIHILKDNPDALARIEANTFRDHLKINSSGFPDGDPKGWSDFLKAFDKWPDGGKATDWGSDTIIVIDTLTALGKAALYRAQKIDSKFGRLPEIQHYHTAMVQLEGLLGNLSSDNISCHVLILTHINYVNNELGAMFGLPMAIGDKLSPKVPMYFNTMLTIKRTGKKTALVTKTNAMVNTKVEAFNSVEDEYPLYDDKGSYPGLANFFRDCGWPGPLNKKGTK